MESAECWIFPDPVTIITYVIPWTSALMLHVHVHVRTHTHTTCYTYSHLVCHWVCLNPSVTNWDTHLVAGWRCRGDDTKQPQPARSSCSRVELFGPSVPQRCVNSTMCPWKYMYTAYYIPIFMHSWAMEYMYKYSIASVCDDRAPPCSQGPSIHPETAVHRCTLTLSGAEQAGNYSMTQAISQLQMCIHFTLHHASL